MPVRRGESGSVDRREAQQQRRTTQDSGAAAIRALHPKPEATAAGTSPGNAPPTSPRRAPHDPSHVSHARKHTRRGRHTHTHARLTRTPATHTRTRTDTHLRLLERLAHVAAALVLELAAQARQLLAQLLALAALRFLARHHLRLKVADGGEAKGCSAGQEGGKGRARGKGEQGGRRGEGDGDRVGEGACGWSAEGDAKRAAWNARPGGSKVRVSGERGPKARVAGERGPPHHKTLGGAPVAIVHIPLPPHSPACPPTPPRCPCCALLLLLRPAAAAAPRTHPL